MDQIEPSSKSYLETVKDMPTTKKAFLGAAAMTPVSAFYAAFLSSTNANTVLYAIGVALGLIGLVGLIGLIVITVKEDSLGGNGGIRSDPLRIAFIVASVFTIIGDAVFANLSAVSGVAVIAITIVREQKNGDENRENATLGSNKPTGLL